jgi:transcriptional regulator with XRE-family HTH domain
VQIYNLNDIADVKAFKKKLNETRKEKFFTQERFAEGLHLCRTTVVNWENCKKNINTLPTLLTFTEICNLLKVDPNYLLGVNEFDSQNDHAISETIGLSVKNVKLLKENRYCNRLIDSFLSSDEAIDIIERIRRICHLEFISQALETSFSKSIRDKIDKAFNKFFEEVFPLDMSKDKFIEYLKKEITLKRIEDIDCFIKESITESEFNNIIVNVFGDFESHTKEERYNILIEYIAECAYDYKMGCSNIELSKYKIATSLFNIVDKYIESTVADFKKSNKTFMP